MALPASVSDVTTYTAFSFAACAKIFVSFGIIRRLSGLNSFLFLASYSVAANTPAVVQRGFFIQQSDQKARIEHCHLPFLVRAIAHNL